MEDVLRLSTNCNDGLWCYHGVRFTLYFEPTKRGEWDRFHLHSGVVSGKACGMVRFRIPFGLWPVKRVTHGDDLWLDPVFDMKSIERMEIEVVIGLWVGDGELNELVAIIKVNYEYCSVK